MGHFDWGNWLYGLFWAVIGGGSNAALAALVVNLQDPKDYNATTWAFFNLTMTLFCYGAVKDFFLYLKSHPLPALIEKTVETHTVEKTISPAPVEIEEPKPKENQ